MQKMDSCSVWTITNAVIQRNETTYPSSYLWKDNKRDPQQFQGSLICAAADASHEWGMSDGVLLNQQATQNWNDGRMVAQPSQAGYADFVCDHHGASILLLLCDCCHGTDMKHVAPPILLLEEDVRW